MEQPILNALFWVLALAIPGVGLWWLGRRHRGAHANPSATRTPGRRT